MHHLLRARAVHLLAHDALDLAQHAQPERQELVDPSPHLADVPAAQQQPVRGVLARLGGVFAQRGE
jgi:hypothetical protein